jgi:hypothetical protein
VQKFRTAALIGAVVLAAAGLAGASASELARTHVLTVRLPDGSIEQIRYLGDRPPQIRWTQDPAPLFWPGIERMDMNSPFAALDRVSAEMDREAQALLNQTADLRDSAIGFPDPLALIDSGRLAPGARSFSVVSTLSGGHMCTRSVEVFPSPDGGRPRIVMRTSGDCGAGARGSLPSAIQPRGEPVRMRPGLIVARSSRPRPRATGSQSGESLRDRQAVARRAISPPARLARRSRGPRLGWTRLGRGDFASLA